MINLGRSDEVRKSATAESTKPETAVAERTVQQRSVKFYIFNIIPRVLSIRFLVSASTGCRVLWEGARLILVATAGSRCI